MRYFFKVIDPHHCRRAIAYTMQDTHGWLYRYGTGIIYTRYNLVCQVLSLTADNTGNKTLTRIPVNVLCAHAKPRFSLLLLVHKDGHC